MAKPTRQLLAKDPIGVFDSGLGGLTVVKEIIRALPHENIVYFGDTARVPYGTKSKESIIRFSHENADVLLKHNVKMIVVACNSSSSYALHRLKAYCPVLVRGVIEPSVKQAVAKTRNRRIGVIATAATIASQAYPTAILKSDSSIAVTAQACPLFVPLVEEGWMGSPIARDIARQYLMPLKNGEIDTLILGCTHYPLLKPVLRHVLGAGVTLIDSAEAVACEVAQLLDRQDLAYHGKRTPSYTFLVSDKPQSFKRIAETFLALEPSASLRVSWRRYKAS